MSRRPPKAAEPERVEIPDLDDYEDDAIAVAVMRLGPRAKTILLRAAELARDGFDPWRDELLYEPDGDIEDPDTDERGRADGAEFLAGFFELLAKQTRGSQRARRR